MIVHSGLSALPKEVKICLLGIVLLFVSVTGIYAASLPWHGTGDSPRHLDYVYQVSQGHLPQVEPGIQHQPMRETTRDIGQTAAKHPPLFYVLLAPLMGGSLESGNWHMAVAIGRAISIAIGVLCVAAFAWTGYVLGGKRKHLFMVALPVVAAFQSAFLFVTGDIRGDHLAILFSTLALATMYKVLQDGLTKNGVVFLALFSALGMASRVSYIVMLFVTLVGVVIAGFIHEKKRAAALKGVAALTVISSLVAIAVGWFYYFNNYAKTGSWIGGFNPKIVEYFHEVRDYKSLNDVIFGPDIYVAAAQIFKDHPPLLVSVTVVFALFVSAAIYFLKDRSWKRLTGNKPILAFVLLLIVLCAGVAAGQIKHATGYGAISARFFLPALLPLALVFAYGLLRWTFRGQLIVAYLLFLIYCFFAQFDIWLVTRVSRKLYEGLPFFEKLQVSLEQNGVPLQLLPVLLTAGLAGLIMISFSLFRLTNQNSNRVAN